MRHDLTISRGNRYDADGYRLTDRHSPLSAFGGIAGNADGSDRITWDGTFLPDCADCHAVEQVIRQVIADGVARTITVGEDAPAGAPLPEYRSRRGLTLTEEMDRADSAF